MKVILSVIALITVVAAGIVYSYDPLFWSRYGGLLKSQLLQQPRGLWYSPLETVAGGEGSPLRYWSQQNLQIPAAALDNAEHYVAARRTSSFIVWHNGAVARERYFDGYDSDTLIVSKSMAKPLASMLMARALEQGYFTSLDQPAADFITEWQGTEKEAITLRHILNMSSGLWRFYRDTLNPFSYFHRGFLSSRHEDIAINKLPLQDVPGSYYDYSQLTSDIIAILIERATGRRYAHYLSTQLLQPIGAAGGKVWINREAGLAHSGCCILLPARTWLRLGILLVQNGVWEGQRLLPDTWNADILSGSATHSNYALNFWLGSPYQQRRYFINPQHLTTPGVWQSEPYAADDLFMFDGNGSQVVYIVPSRRLVIVRTGQWPGRGADGREWDNTFLPNSIIRALDNSAGGHHRAAPKSTEGSDA